MKESIWPWKYFKTIYLGTRNLVMFNFVFFLNFTYENDVEIEKPVDEVEMPGLYPVQVGAVGCEDVVLDDVEGGERRLAIVLKNGSMLTHQQHLFTTKSQLTFCLLDGSTELALAEREFLKLSCCCLLPYSFLVWAEVKIAF